jgi:hypothetical protein
MVTGLAGNPSRACDHQPVTRYLPAAGLMSGRITPELAAEFAQAGVHRLVVLAPPTADGPARTIEAAAAAISAL